MDAIIITKMVDAMHLQQDDVVLINEWCEEKSADLQRFADAIKRKGCKCHTIVFSEQYQLELVEKYAQGLDDAWFEPYSDVTVVIDMMERPIGLPPHSLQQERYPIFGRILQDLFGFMGSHEKMIQITMPPTDDLAMAERITKALDVDYEQLDKACREKVAELGDKQIFTITTGENCELHMETTGREWNVDAGEGAFPCGEIYIAPLEEKTNGSIFFSTFIIEGIGSFDDVILKIEDGCVVDSNCEPLNQFLNQQDEGARVVGELGIGMNPAVEFSGTGADLDEDALGTFHIGLGMNFMFGGKNNCRFHMDFVTTGVIQ